MNIVLIKTNLSEELILWIIIPAILYCFSFHSVILSIFLHKPPHMSCAVAAMDGLVFKLKADSKNEEEKKKK